MGEFPAVVADWKNNKDEIKFDEEVGEATTLRAAGRWSTHVLRFSQYPDHQRCKKKTSKLFPALCRLLWKVSKIVGGVFLHSMSFGTESQSLLRVRPGTRLVRHNGPWNTVLQ